MDKSVPAKPNPISRIVQYILEYTPATKMKLPVIGVPSSFPTPKKNHVRGMRRKAKIEGRKSFVVQGRRRKV